MPPGRTAGTEYVPRQLTPEEEAALAAEAAAAEYGIGPAAATGDPAVVYAEEQAAPPPVAAEPQYAPVEPGMYEEPYVAPGQYAAQAPAPASTTPDMGYDQQVGSADPYGAIGAVQTLPATTENGTDWAAMIAPPVSAAGAPGRTIIPAPTPYAPTDPPVTRLPGGSPGPATWPEGTTPPREDARRGQREEPVGDALAAGATQLGVRDAVEPFLGALIDSAGRTISDIVNTDPAANRRAVGELAGNVINTDPAANRKGVLDKTPQGIKDFGSWLGNIKDRAGSRSVPLPYAERDPMLDNFSNQGDMLRAAAEGVQDHPPDAVLNAMGAFITAPGMFADFLYDNNYFPLPAPEGEAPNPLTATGLGLLVGGPNTAMQAEERTGLAREAPAELSASARAAGDRLGRIPAGGRESLQEAADDGSQLVESTTSATGESVSALRGALRLPRIPTLPEGVVNVMNTSLPTLPGTDGPPASVWEQVGVTSPMGFGGEVGAYLRELYDREQAAEMVRNTVAPRDAGGPDISLLSGDRDYDAIEAQRANRPPIEAPPVAYDPLSSAYLPREPGLLDQATDAISGAVDAARNVELPDIALPDVSLTDLIPGRNAPAARATTGEPIVTRRQAFPEEARANDIRNLPAQYVPTEPGMLDKARGMIPSDIALPDVDLPGIDVAGTARGARDAIAGRISGGGDAPLPTPTPSSPALDAVFAEEAAAAAAALPEGVREVSGATESGVVLLQDANGVNVGIVQADGTPFVFPEEWTDDQKNTKYQEVKDALGAAAPAAGNPAPGPATGAATVPPTSTSSTSTTTNTGGGDYTVTDYSDDYQPRSSGSSRSRSRSYEYDDEGDEDVGLSIEDFLRDHDGDGRISQRDRMVAKRLFAEAKKSRFGKGKGRKRGRSTVPQFPESPIRTNVLAALSEAFGR